MKLIVCLIDRMRRFILKIILFYEAVAAEEENVYDIGKDIIVLLQSLLDPVLLAHAATPPFRQAFMI